jgi:hypothetical protein
VSVPLTNGSGETPGNVNEVEPSKTVTDQARLPSGFLISAECSVAPATGANA